MNLEVIYEHYSEILADIESDHPFEGPTLFIRGGKSDYVADTDMDKIKQLFPNARLETVPNAGHWVHAEQPEILSRLVSDFLSE